MRIFALVLAALFWIAIGATYAIWNRSATALEHPADPTAPELTVMVPPNADASAVLRILNEKNLVADAKGLERFVTHVRRPLSPRPGEYALSRALSPLQILQRIESGKVVQHTVVVPPGASVTDIVAALAGKGLGDAAILTAKAQDPAFLTKLGLFGASLEGWLLPDVYNLPRGLGEEVLWAQLVDHARSQRPQAELAQAAKVGRTELQVLTVASLIEAAEILPEERRLYAALLWGRNDRQMPLQTPASDRYGQLRQDPSYDTEKRPGLPPGPICSPSLASISAAAAPASSRALYWVERDNRTHVFCDDLECYLAALAEWKRPVPAKIPRPKP